MNWAYLYTSWTLFLLSGIAIGWRAAWWHYVIARRRLVWRWRLERRLHRQKNPWVKKWVQYNRPFPWVRIGKGQYEMPDGVFFVSHDDALRSGEEK